MDELRLIPLFLLASLAVYRLSYMVTNEDGPFDLFYKWRSLLIRWEVKRQKPHWIISGFHCVHCTGFWVALLMSPLVYNWVYELRLSVTGWGWTNVGECTILALGLSMMTYVYKRLLG